MKASIVVATLSLLVSASPPERRFRQDAGWNIQAISHRHPPRKINGKYRDTGYLYNRWPEDKEFYAYVLDSGIRTTHHEFGDRAKNLWTAFQDADGRYEFEDVTGHGTHVAGIIASTTYGVAEQARVLSVKVLDANDEALVSEAIAGFNAAVKHIIEHGRQHRAVITHSGGAGWEYSAAWRTAVRGALEAPGGPILTVVSSGNDGANVDYTAPACLDEVISVGSMEMDWKISPTSNYGCQVDILAPGDRIKSLSHTADDDLVIMSGTSAAAPHVAAVALNAMAVFGKSSGQVSDFLRQTATRGRVRGILRDTPNLLVNNNNPVQW
ncbi:subtilisin-like protease PR1F [Metarhizium album ARSEF 1941]|uniref:Subtilisin-like protease PR1F n=1 Tax=Metarhizium album (strain ARSEF 1941) TaxID=1081103 RepID=A0A0B2WXW5_METAS|nr:subtilisin-like protease PR1F [Metarhizium album ARSEF 1941]KHN98883.1 subtilisin-like protease PR1F [Metarhizium album ARSEF 1941]